MHCLVCSIWPSAEKIVILGMIQRKLDQAAHQKISVHQLEYFIQSSGSSALRFNAYIPGAIIKISVGFDYTTGQPIYHQFERTCDRFRDLNLCN